ncbi:hypothetical protein J2T57_001472 [Natronocella acetinitrilica]|uniref:Uncharacterized protein n=1 Tax=Natronocella acetinitrilica TaxID=414046 RepID=A0AAE3G284_9GAMM|nr:hypothetical protein [Natronocella acetinitrilica]MCP1674370.1 hypothetical protein [Natronocella acetinitrilica]
MGQERDQEAARQAFLEECLRELMDGVAAGRSRVWVRHRLREALANGVSRSTLAGAASYALTGGAARRFSVLLSEIPVPDRPSAGDGAAGGEGAAGAGSTRTSFAQFMMSWPGQALALLALLVTTWLLLAIAPARVVELTSPSLASRYLPPVLIHAMIWAPLFAIADWQQRRLGRVSLWTPWFGLYLSPILFMGAYFWTAETPAESMAAFWGLVFLAMVRLMLIGLVVAGAFRLWYGEEDGPLSPRSVEIVVFTCLCALAVLYFIGLNIGD